MKLQLIDEGEDEELELEEEEESNDDLPDPSQYSEGDTLALETKEQDEDFNINSDFRFSRLEFERSEENSGEPYVCPFCSSKFTMVDTLRQHAVISHLHLLFYSAKLPYISNVEFKSCCEKLLKDQTSASTTSSGYQCSQCNVGFKVLRQFHNHLFLLHFDSLLLPKLADIQNEYHDDQPSILKHALTSAPSKPGTQFSCSFCTRIFTSSWNLKCHSGSFHLDQFLTAAKLEHISNEKFQSMCTILYEKETDNKTDGERRYTCSHCSSSYSDRRILMLHLLDTHYNILIEKLEELQKNPSRTKLFAPPSGDRQSRQKYVCKPCDIEFNNLLMYKRHKLKVHPEQASYTCASCGLKLFTQTEWIKHRMIYCTMRKSSVHKAPSAGKNRSVNANGRGTGGDDEELEETTHPAVQEILTKLRNSECDSSNHILCPVCAENNGVTMFNDVRQLVRHVVSFHAEHFFMPLKKPEMAISTFSGFCTQLFGEDKFSSIKDAASGILIFKCPYCSAMFNEKKSAQRHQIQVHYSTLCDELEKAMQRSGNALAKPINAPPATSKAFGAAAAQVVKGFVPVLSRSSQHSQPQPANSRGFKRCPRCQKCFSKTTNIQRHMNSLACQQGTSTSRPARRTTTMEDLGPNRNIYPCQYCGKLLSCLSNRTRHIKMHCPQAKEAQAHSNYVTNPTGSGDNDLVNSNWEDENEDSYVISYGDDEESMEYKEEPVENPTDNEPCSSSSFVVFPGNNIEEDEEVVGGEETGGVQEDMNFVNIGQLGQSEDGIHLDELPYEDPLGM